jgi:hypothetical protein
MMRQQLAFLLYAVVITEIYGGWVDPDTPDEFLSTTAHYTQDTREYELVCYKLPSFLLRCLARLYLSLYLNSQFILIF